MKKQLSLLLGLLFVSSATIFLTSASELDYAQSLREKVSKNRSLRRFSEAVRYGNGRTYARKQKTLNVQKDTAGNRFLRPRKTVSLVSEKKVGIVRRTTNRSMGLRQSTYKAKKTLQKKAVLVAPKTVLRPRTVAKQETKKTVGVEKKTTNRTTALVKKGFQKKSLKKNDFQPTVFKPVLRRVVATDEFGFSLPVDFVTTAQSNKKFKAKKRQHTFVSIQNIDITPSLSFQTMAQGFLKSKMQESFGYASVKQSIKLSSSFGKNRLKYLQTPPTEYFEKVSLVNNTVVVQRLQQNPKGGLMYIEFTAPKSKLSTVLNDAHTVFSSFFVR